MNDVTHSHLPRVVVRVMKWLLGTASMLLPPVSCIVQILCREWGGKGGPIRSCTGGEEGSILKGGNLTREGMLGKVLDVSKQNW